RDRYLARVAMIREAIPDISLTTDIIVGFPGESEADFDQTLALAEEVQFDAAYTFIYSPRRDTEAALITEGLVSAEQASERIGRLIEVVQRGALERAQRFVGRSVEVLVEGRSRTDAERIRGRTRHNKAVNFVGIAEPGELVMVEIESATSTSLSGRATLLASALR
ncbi:MAG: TRAM domain-containing protein, partial [Actinomycetes bacterium]